MGTVLVTQFSKNVINSGYEKDIEIGEIHSIFESSINLKFNFGLVNIIKEEYQKLPFSIEIEELILNSIVEKSKIGDKVRLDRLKKALILEDANIEILFVSKPYDCILDKYNIDESKIKDSFDKVSDFIISSSIENGFGISNNLFLDVVKYTTQNHKVKKYSDKKSKEIRQKQEGSKKLEEKFVYFTNKLLHIVNKENNKNDVFDYFIGRGKGLTPSGDDLMLGLISMLKVVDKDNISKDLLSYLEEHGSKRTTDISLEYLKYACKGSIGKNIKTTCEGLITSDCNIDKYLDKLSKKGHSSGIDTILGIYLAMIIINKEIN